MTEAINFSELRERLPGGPWRHGVYFIMTDNGTVLVETDQPMSVAIARAIASIPDMLAEIERLQNALGAETARLNRALDLAQEQGEANARLRSQNAEMRELLTNSCCPRSVTGFKPAFRCLQNLECGCNIGTILAKTESP